MNKIMGGINICMMLIEKGITSIHHSFNPIEL